MADDTDYSEYSRVTWARCKSGKRWFWCVWKSWTEIIIAHGTADSPEDCKEQAAHYNPEHEERAGFAASKRRRLAAQKRQAKAINHPATTTSTAIDEYVYHLPYDGDGLYRHKIVKRSAKTISVIEEGEYCHSDGEPAWQRSKPDDWRRWSVPTIALNRFDLEQHGSVWHRPSRERYWISIERRRQEIESTRNRLPDLLLSTLQLDSSATISQAKKKYRQMLRLTHPDSGGSTEAFQNIRQLQESYSFLA